MVGPAGLGETASETVMREALDILANDGGSSVWADACTGSGFCIAACGEGINPRFLLALARVISRGAEAGAEKAREAGIKRFQGLSRNVRLLSRLQLTPEELNRLGFDPHPADGPENPEITLYIGCNVNRTPHIALLCLDVLDALGVTYAVKGGPAHCCGVQHQGAGDGDAAGGVAFGTVELLAQAGAETVLSWCPGCHNQFSEMVLPAYTRTTGEAPFDMTMFIPYLADRLDRLRPLMAWRVEKRVGLHEHPGSPGVSEAAVRLLKAIPGLEYVDLPQPQIGNSCTGFQKLPQVKADAHAGLLAQAEAAGVTTLAGVYHSCHREICGHEQDWPFEVVNIMELIGESLGLTRPDLYKRFNAMKDVDAILADSRDMIAAHGMDVAELRDEIAGGLFAG